MTRSQCASVALTIACRTSSRQLVAYAQLVEPSPATETRRNAAMGQVRLTLAAHCDHLDLNDAGGHTWQNLALLGL